MNGSTQIAFTTPPQASAPARWLVFSPGARIVAFVLTAILLSLAFGAITHVLGIDPRQAGAHAKAITDFLSRAILPLLAYLLVVKLIERRRIRELALRRLLPEGVGGAVSGFALFSLIVGILWALGSYRVTGFNHGISVFAPVMVFGLGAGIGEEIMFRGVLFRMVEEGLGTWVALLVSAAFFGLVHIRNPGATAWSSAAIAIEAGLLFGMLYHVTRSLYLCMGLHAAWNVTQGVFYGIPVSGMDVRGWMISRRSGPDWLSGGAFGAEASVVALGCCSLITLALLVVALRRGSIVAPAWVRRRHAVVESHAPQAVTETDPLALARNDAA